MFCPSAEPTAKPALTMMKCKHLFCLYVLLQRGNFHSLSSDLGSKFFLYKTRICKKCVFLISSEVLSQWGMWGWGWLRAQIDKLRLLEYFVHGIIIWNTPLGSDSLGKISPYSDTCWKWFMGQKKVENHWVRHRRNNVYKIPVRVCISYTFRNKQKKFERKMKKNNVRIKIDKAGKLEIKLPSAAGHQFKKWTDKKMVIFYYFFFVVGLK